MLTPVTGVDALAPGRRRLRGTPAARDTDDTRHRLMRPETVADRRAIRSVVESEAAAGELAISRTMVGVAALGVLLLLIAGSTMGWSIAGRFMALCTVAAGYFGMVWHVLRSPGRFRPALLHVRWTNATLEPTFISLGIVLVASSAGQAVAAQSPVFLFYALVLAVGAARLRPGLTVYGAGVACVQYLALHYLYLAPELEADLSAVAWQRVVFLMLVAGVLAFVTERMRSMARHSGTEAWRRRRLEDEFGRYVSPDVARAILHGEAGYAAERREVTVLFCDVRDFTTLCERQPPEEVVDMLNEFYGRLCTIIEQRGGTVNKFLGDGLLALFNAPEEHPNHSVAAAEAAHEILYACDELRSAGGRWRHLEVGIGLDTGDVVCGPLGARNRLEYTAIGSTVNRAARLQGLSRKAQYRIVLSKECVDRLGPRANVVALGRVDLKGFEEAQPVFAFRHS